MEDMESVSSGPDENPWPHLTEYVEFVSRSGQQILFACKRCLPKDTKIKVHVSSLNNLKQHVRRVHESQYVQFEEIVKAGSNRGKTKRRTHSDDDDSTSSSNPNPVKRRIQQGRQLSIGESFGIAATGSGVPQAKVDECIVNLFVSNMIPLHVVESKSFGALIKTLNPSKNSISRRTLGRRITDEHIELKQHLIRTTTDNGSNFVKAFVQFGSEIDILPELPSCDLESEFDPDIANLLNPNSEENDDLEFISVENILNAPDRLHCNEINEQILENFNTLPIHMRCAAHTFNLVASKDVDAALQITVFKTPYRSALAKARTLWNQQSRSTVAADSIHAELGRRLVLPNTTRWNSLYDAIVVLNSILETKRPSLHRVMTQLKILTFNDQDVTVMKEYAKVMAPVANALDRIQGEAQAYLGSLLPTIAATVYKLKNIKSKGLVNCTALANALLNGIEKRFGPLLNDEQCLLAAAFHPKFRLIWLETYDSSRVDAVKKSMEKKVEDALRQEAAENSKDRDSLTGGGSNASNNDDDEEEDFFNSVTRSIEKPKSSNSLKSKAQSLVKMWLDMKSKDSFNDAAFLGEQIFINLFIKYNTAIPSSAAVERLFSTGKDILTPKRASLSDENFNMLMFMKGNMHLMPDD
ncbi:unnamed protein product [Diatraea saccharalis]|uniref:HAT C-terminal dimerisation domain-containing protein n=1 Tax=Diatraea saccharalis TaxID=40085 RepID=A0A9N9R8P8_9NEOP|nr:unnamed protein product [Diatraea saccharalis]